ncbi:hypothetical protein PV439_11775 [Streptomyces scabiei]|uniref:hypothetical protein n=1 Tax=Streptomyces scabiei TaxID=1930 RepID=UPI0029907347|nr:hypothetical protein [Streptomyces scabiei]MDW8804612.1 hypothetical protein [Streptomyces scabiei]MDX2652308.1 hypothetical protein [Streptomyces scabiei]MDX2869075.1 hypothetical protein [Streptomyces scabiei]MDX2889669.1 hypothetical protein [Streptomyces scabiei]MDX2892021.1 hypothetical protein [Streptomyces scabiei]
MSLTLLREANRRGVSSLVQAARANWHTVPEDLADSYADLEALATSYASNPQQSTADDAADLTAELVTAISGGAADGIINDHIKPALADFLTDFQTDVTTAGPYAALPEPTPQLATESDSVQQAYQRLRQANTGWQSIRASWRILRGRSHALTRDPAGLASLHAEIANTLELRPIWDPASSLSSLASPWQHGAFHVRLKWLLDHDAEVWTPTANEQTTAWLDNNPELSRR